MNDNVEILRRYNRWRRGQALWSATADLPDPRVVGEAIDAACDEIERLRAELEECRRDAERYRTALEQIVAPFEDLNFVSGNKLLTYIHDVATVALAAKEEK